MSPGTVATGHGPCALCGAEALQAETPAYLACARCGTLSQADLPGVSRVEESAERYAHGISAQDERWMGLIEGLAPPGRRLLDLGCGNGAFVELAARRGWSVTGVEASAAMVRDARSRGCQVHRADLDDWVPGGAFDVVRLWFVLEHVRQPGRLLAEGLRALAGRGLLALAVPNDAGWLSRRVMASPADRFWEHPLHLHHFPPFGLERWVESRGCSLEIAESGRPTELMRGGSLPLCEVWEETRALHPGLSRLFYQLGVGRTREVVFRRL